MLYALIALTQVLGDIGDLHAAIDMEAIDLATVLRYAGQTTFQLLRNLTDTQNGLGRFIDGIGVFQIMLVGPQ